MGVGAAHSCLTVEATRYEFGIEIMIEIAGRLLGRHLQRTYSLTRLQAM